MSYLSNLYWKLSNLKSQKSDIESELWKLRNRKSGLERLVNNLESIGDNHYSYVNGYANKILDNFPYTLKGTKSVGGILNAVSSGIEKSSGSDRNISSALNELRSEISRVTTQISNLESNLSSNNSGIITTSNAIRYEERRIAKEEARRKEEQRQREEASKKK